MTDREKLIDLIDEAAELYHSEREAIADHLLANGVTIKDSCIGCVVWGIWDVTEFRRNEKKKNRKVQITNTRRLKYAMEHGAVEVREKVCTKSDLTFMGKTVFRTREEAERMIL